MAKNSSKRKPPGQGQPPPDPRSKRGRGGARTIPHGTAQRTAQRVRRRRRQMILFYIFTFLFVVIGAVALSLTVLFKIDTIQIEGSSRYTAQQILKACGISKGENLFLVKTGQASAAVVQKLPYIGEAVVSRGLPAKIKITVKETNVTYALQSGEKYAYLDHTGKVLELADAVPESASVLRGLALSSMKVGYPILCKDATAFETFQTLEESLKKNEISPVTAIDMSDPYNLVVIYDGRVAMKLGYPDKINYKLRYAKRILTKDEDIREKARGTLDLSNVESNKVPFEPNYGTG